jgi:hypothetical protein
VPTELDPLVVTPGSLFSPDEYWLSNAYYSQLYQNIAGSYPYSNVTDFALDTMAGQPNYVEVPHQDTTPLEPIEVTAPRLPPGDQRDSEGYSYNPDTGVPYPPTWAMNDAEYADFLGGGDSAYEQMWAERHGDEPVSPNETFMPPVGLLYPAVGTLATLGQVLLGGLGAILFPQPTAPRELDEAPTPYKPPPRPPTNTPLPEFADPSPPNWSDIAYDFDPLDFNFPTPKPEFDFDFKPITKLAPFLEYLFRTDDLGDSQQRRILPISDNPGLFADAPRLPSFPEPFIPFAPTTRPGPSPVPVPDWVTPYTPVDPFSPYIADPGPFYQPEPIVRPGPAPTPRPEPFPDVRTAPGPIYNPLPYDPTLPDIYSPPRTDAPPRVGDPLPDFYNPYAPPDVLLPPLPDFMTPPLPGAFADPGDLLQFAPDKADKCNCVKTKDKKKKKKSKPRQICYEGHYIEHSRGLTKVRGKQIPCDQVNVRAPRRKTPGLPDLAKDIFGLP